MTDQPATGYIVKLPVQKNLGLSPKVRIDKNQLRRFINACATLDLDDDEAVSAALSELYYGASMLLELGQLAPAPQVVTPPPDLGRIIGGPGA